jgi:chromosome segregation and condensation protein ScpB
MADANQLRERGTRLLALALNARLSGQAEYADALTRMATESFDQASDTELRFAGARTVPYAQPAQQQQQPQPDDPGREQSD